MQEVSKLWKVGLNDDDRRYYNKVSELPFPFNTIRHEVKPAERHNVIFQPCSTWSFVKLHFGLVVCQ